MVSFFRIKLIVRKIWSFHSLSHSFFVIQSSCYMPKTTTIVFLIALSTLAGIHLLALQLFLYWRYLWLDIPVHALGGAVVALGVFAARDLRLPAASHFSKRPVTVMYCVVAVMVVWEFFQLWAGKPMIDNYMYDTALDLVMGFLGGMLGYYIAFNLDSLK